MRIDHGRIEHETPYGPAFTDRPLTRGELDLLVAVIGAYGPPYHAEMMAVDVTEAGIYVELRARDSSGAIILDGDRVARERVRIDLATTREPVT